MVTIPSFITDEAQGRNTFVDTQKIRGLLQNVSIEKSKNPIPSGRNAGKTRCAAVFSFRNIEILILDDSTTPDAKEWSIRYDLAEWDVSNGRPKPPEKRGDWFTYVVPKFAELGIDLNDPSNSVTGLTVRLNKVWEFELMEFERDYEIDLRDPDTNEIIWERDPGTLSDNDEGQAKRVKAVYRKQFPTEIPGPKATKDEALARTSELWELYEGDVEKFKEAAISDPIIEQVNAVRRDIQTDKWIPEVVEA